MKISDIMNAGCAATDSHISAMAEGMVKNLVALRIKELEQKLEETDSKLTKDEIQKKISCLRDSQAVFYRNLVKEIEQNLTVEIKRVIDTAAVNLINAEYFGFSGRIK